MSNESKDLASEQIHKINQISKWAEELESVASNEDQDEWIKLYTARPIERYTALQLIQKNASMATALVKLTSIFKDTEYSLIGTAEKITETLESIVIRYMNNQNVVSSVYFKPEEEAIILANYQSMTDKQLGELIGRNEISVYSYRYQNNLSKLEQYTSDEVATLTKMFNDGKSDEEIALALGRSVKSIMGKRRIERLLRQDAKAQWTKEEQTILLESLRIGEPIDKILEKLDRTKSSVTSRITYLNLADENAYQWDVHQDETAFLKDTFTVLEDSEIAAQLNRPTWQIVRKRLQLDILRSEEKELFTAYEDLKTDNHKRQACLKYLNTRARFSPIEIARSLSLDLQYVMGRLDEINNNKPITRDVYPFNKTQVEHIQKWLNAKDYSFSSRIKLAEELGVNHKKLERYLDSMVQEN